MDVIEDIVSNVLTQLMITFRKCSWNITPHNNVCVSEAQVAPIEKNIRHLRALDSRARQTPFLHLRPTQNNRIKSKTAFGWLGGRDKHDGGKTG